MAGGRLVSCSFAHTGPIVHLLLLLLLLLLVVGRHDVEASSCQRLVLKQVGETVELSSCLPLLGVTYAEWKYRGDLLAVTGSNVTPPRQFVGRVKFNHTDFRLTLTHLTQGDSGNFTMNTDGTEGQRTEVFTLKVHHPINASILLVNSTWHPSNASCTFFLECASTSDSDVSYNWTVGNRTLEGPGLWHSARRQDGDATFTCSASNPNTQQSVSRTLRCGNGTSDPSKPGLDKRALLLFGGVAVGGCLIVVIVTAVGVYCCNRRKAASLALNSNDVTVYADIDDIVRERTADMKPCSVYESIERPGLTAKQNYKPDTVYDMIQLSRMKETVVSPYRELQRTDQ